ncbi:MAG: hypothetical protein RR576_09420 [Oscillospiraceae bacterium]
MKKIFVLALTAVMALSLVACGGKIKDGTYAAENKNASHGWTDYLSVTYKDGAITEVDYNAKDKDGKLKSDTPDEQYPMEPKLSVWLPELNAQIKAAGTADKIEGVAGATFASSSAKELMKAVEAQAKAGKTDVVVVENAVGE